MSAIRYDDEMPRFVSFSATMDRLGGGVLPGLQTVLKLTQPTLGRQVASLEEELGVVLFERVGSSMNLTPSDLELLDHVRAIRETWRNETL